MAGSRKCARSFLSSRKGVAAIEFALIAPVMVVMLLGVIEAGRFLNANLRLSNATSNFADIAARGKSAKGAEIDSLLKAFPLMLGGAGNNYRVTISGVIWEEDGKAPVVAWQRGGGGLAADGIIGLVGDIAKVPAGMVAEGGDAILVVETEYVHKPLLPVFDSGMTLRSEAYARPRRAAMIELEE